MAINKKTAFQQDEIELADMAKALSHPARLAILKTLADKNSCICGEIVEVLPLAQSTVSQHLKELKKIGLVQGSIDGVKSCYCIDKNKLNKAMQTFQTFFNEIKEKTGCC